MNMRDLITLCEGQISNPEIDRLAKMDPFSKGDTYTSQFREKQLKAKEAKAATQELKAIIKSAKQAGVNIDLYPVVQVYNDNITMKWIENTSTKGSGAKYLQMICDLADKYGLELNLRAHLGEPKLVTYYKRFGFIISPDHEAAVKHRLHIRDDLEGNNLLGSSPFMWRRPKINQS
jgi:tRNA A-37 threonylcarbamoyl transferase component Bud32